jgi:hypothetical protein
VVAGSATFGQETAETPATFEIDAVGAGPCAYRETPMLSAFQSTFGRNGDGTTPVTRVLAATYTRGTAK